MRRLLLALPVALLLTIVVIAPCLAYSASLNPANHFPTGNGYTLDSFTDLKSIYPAADNTTSLPGGLVLTPEVPFISPNEVNKGEPVTIKLKATNNNASAINYALDLKVNDKLSDTQQINLNPSESQDITFTYIAEETGTNNVVVGNLSGTFTAKSGGFWDILPTPIWIVIGVVLAGIVVMSIFLAVTPSRKKKGDRQSEMLRKPQDRKGKQGKHPEPGLQSSIPGQVQRPGVPRMAEPFGMQQTPGFPPMPHEMSTPMMQDMQPPFQPQGQPGMQPPFQPQWQPGMQPPFQPEQSGMQPPFQTQAQQVIQHPTPGIQQPQIRGQQMPQGMQPAPHQPPLMQGMPLPVQPQIANTPPNQQGVSYGLPQQPSPQMPHPTPPPYAAMQPGMPPPMQPSFQPQSYPGMQSPIPGTYQTTGMPKFSTSNLTITPNKVKVGEPVNISIIVSNNGVQTGKYSVVLRISGVVENISDLTLPPGASQTASFTVVKDSPGDYYADIDGLGGFFTVIPLAPPSFMTSNFSIIPERVRQGQPVTITASVTNIGEVAGSHTLILRIKGIAEGQQEVTLEPGKTQNVEFQITKDSPGFYPVSLENWTGKFVVEMDWTG